MGAFMLVQILTSFYFGTIVTNIGRKNAIRYSIWLFVFTTLGFSSLEWVRNPRAFFLVALGLRLVQGAATSLCLISIFSATAIYFKQTRTQAFSALLVGLSLGNLTGPILGTFLYSQGGFAFAFLTMGVILTAFERVISRIVPDFLNKKQDSDCNQTLMGAERESVGYKEVLLNPGSLVALLVTLALQIVWYFWEAILSLHLKEQGASVDLIGAFFALGVVFMGVGAFLGGRNSAPKAFFIPAALLLCSLGNFVMALSGKCSLATEVFVKIAGFSITNIVAAACYVNCLPYLVERTTQELGINEKNESMNDKLSALFNTFVSLGCALAQIVGGYSF